MISARDQCILKERKGKIKKSDFVLQMVCSDLRPPAWHEWLTSYELFLFP